MMALVVIVVVELIVAVEVENDLFQNLYHFAYCLPFHLLVDLLSYFRVPETFHLASFQDQEDHYQDLDSFHLASYLPDFDLLETSFLV
jgi:hypothetical protein